MKHIYELVNKLGFNCFKEISTEILPFEPSLVKLCEMNTCGNYARNYMCPPYVGNTQELMQRVKKYKKAFVFQKVYEIEDSFDVDGMNSAKNDFCKCVHRINDLCKNKGNKYLILGAGGCQLCDVCGVITNEPCRFPQNAVASLESYGIFVSKLAAVCEMNYINGINTVTYFGAVLYE